MLQHEVGPVTLASTVLAHQGGWDEILLVAGPIVIIIAVLAVVKRRVDAMGPLPDDHDTKVMTVTSTNGDEQPR